MFAAVLTSFFFALSAIFGRRSALLLGSQRANLARQLIALVFLGLWAHLFGAGLHGATLGILVFSGVIGFGLGDWALFEAYPRIGAALTILLVQCLASPIAAVTEWLWLGTGMTALQVFGSMIILVGVILAMAPGRESDIPAGHRRAGIIFGIVAAVGQGWGAVLSRYAFSRAHDVGFSLDGITAAYQRLWGGVLMLGILLIVRQLTRRWHSPSATAIRPDWRQGWPWTVANALAGATIGVSCYQWALKSAPSAVVLPIVATTPLMAMGFAFAFEGVRPTLRAMLGALLAVSGVIILVTHR